MTARIRAISGHLLLLLFGAILGCDDESKDESHGSSDDRVATGEISVTDAAGNRRVLAEPPRRIISVAPNLTEFVFLLGAGDRLVGRGQYDDFPPQAREIESVADLSSLNLERIVQLQPDLVLMTSAGNSQRDYHALERLGLTPFVVEAESVTGVLASIDTLGVLLGLPERGRAVSDSLAGIVEKIRQENDGSATPTVFFIIEPSPLYTVSRGFIHEMISLAGGKNIAAGEPIAYPQYSREQVLAQNPDFIVYAGDHPDIGERLLELYPEWGSLSAIRRGNVITIDPDLVLRPGPRMVAGLDSLSRAIRARQQQAAR